MKKGRSGVNSVLFQLQSIYSPITKLGLTADLLFVEVRLRLGQLAVAHVNIQNKDYTLT